MHKLFTSTNQFQSRTVNNINLIANYLHEIVMKRMLNNQAKLHLQASIASLFWLASYTCRYLAVWVHINGRKQEVTDPMHSGPSTHKESFLVLQLQKSRQKFKGQLQHMQQ